MVVKRSHQFYNRIIGSETRKDEELAHKENTLTEFGATVLGIMGEKGVVSQSMLSSLLSQQGLNISQRQISKYLYGKAAVSREFPRAFADALALDIAQRGKLADAYTFGQCKEIRDISVAS